MDDKQHPDILLPYQTLENSLYNEPVPDHGAKFRNPLPEEDIYEGHKSRNISASKFMYMASNYDNRSAKRRYKQSTGDGPGTERRLSLDFDEEDEEDNPEKKPSEKVRELINAEDMKDIKVAGMFVEMDELKKVGKETAWKETARWVKFEENVDEDGQRWSKPFVATVSLSALLNVRRAVQKGPTLLDLEANSLPEIANHILDHMVSNHQINPEHREAVFEILQRRHYHQFTRPKEDVSRTDLKPKKLPVKPKSKSNQNVEIKNMIPARDAVGSFSDIAKRTDEEPTSVASSNITGGSLPDLHNQALFIPITHAVSGEVYTSNDDVENTRSRHSSGPGNQSAENDKKKKDKGDKFNEQFLRKIPQGAEAANLLVGEVDFLLHPIASFVRLHESKVLGNITEVPLPSKILFVYLGPPSSKANSVTPRDVGRSVGALLADEVFQEVVYKAKTRDDLLNGIDEFMEHLTVLPPSEWDPSTRIEPPLKLPSQADRKTPPDPPKKPENGIPGEHMAKPPEPPKINLPDRGDPTLVRTGKICGGLIQDVKRKIPFYLSDFRDSLAPQTLGTVIFMYFACITPTINFGLGLEKATKGNIGALEYLLACWLHGLTFYLFAGQPLIIIGATGPIKVMEIIIAANCFDNNTDFLPMRWWVAFWTFVILMVMVIFDLSFLVKYITRYTEECFATLISLIYITESFQNLAKVLNKYPLQKNTAGQAFKNVSYHCYCDMSERLLSKTNSSIANVFNNDSAIFIADYNTAAPDDFNLSSSVSVTADFDQSTVSSVAGYTTTEKHPVQLLFNNTVFTLEELLKYFEYLVVLPRKQCEQLGGKMKGAACETFPDVFFFCVIIMAMSFGIVYGLKQFKLSGYFPTSVRRGLSDFAVAIAFAITIGLDAGLQLATPKLIVPLVFAPTNGRPWLVKPSKDPKDVFTGLGYAILLVILLFMMQQITAVIVNRPEHKLKKGGGYHLDLTCLAVTSFIAGILGLPWYTGATVLSINHIRSLSLESDTAAPGEKPKFLGVREQRVSGFMVYGLLGASIFFAKALRFVPLPVLWGIFVFMGVASLKELQFFHRILLFLMPVKYQPDYTYLRKVRLWRVHLFTVIQMVSMAILWTFKSVKGIDVIFPLIVLGLTFVRKAMDWIFSPHELKHLDTIMPVSEKKNKKKRKKKGGDDDDDRVIDLAGGAVSIPLSDGKMVTLPVDHIIYDPQTKEFNISEEMAKTGVWKNIVDKDIRATKDLDEKEDKSDVRYRKGSLLAGISNPSFQYDSHV